MPAIKLRDRAPSVGSPSDIRALLRPRLVEIDEASIWMQTHLDELEALEGLAVAVACGPALGDPRVRG